jgi:hypothetical protein
MKVAGVLFCLSAVVSLVGPYIQKEAFGWTTTDATSAGGALMVLLFGAALFQGVGAVRGLVLVAAGLGALAALVAIALLGQARELQMLLGALLLVCAGYVVLLIEKRATRTRAAAGVALVLAGALGGLAAPHWLTGLARSAFGQELRPLLAEEREYTDPSSGLSLQAPAGWSLLREDATLFAGVPAKVKLADPDAGTVVFINDEPRGPGFVSLDHQLDRILESQRENGLEPRQHERRDAAVGAATARRMSMAWTYEGRPFNGFVSVWLDGPRVFTLFGAAVGSVSPGSEARFRALETSLRFSAPIETALAGAGRAFAEQCPVFTAEAIRMIGRRIPPSSAVQTYFRTGWGWAIRGQAEVDPATQAELRELMSAVFARMRATDRARFAAYSERVRADASTTRSEDAAAMRILGAAAAALPRETLARLQTTLSSVITVGGLL